MDFFNQKKLKVKTFHHFYYKITSCGCLAVPPPPTSRSLYSPSIIYMQVMQRVCALLAPGANCHAANEATPAHTPLTQCQQSSTASVWGRRTPPLRHPRLSQSQTTSDPDPELPIICRWAANKRPMSPTSPKNSPDSKAEVRCHGVI